MDEPLFRANGNCSLSSAGTGVSFHTSIDRRGTVQPQRLTVADEEIALYDGAGDTLDGPGVIQARWPRQRIAAFRVEQFIGSSFLQARVDGQWIDLLRCPNGGTERLREFAARLDKWLRDGRWPDGNARTGFATVGAEASPAGTALSRWFRAGPAWTATSSSGWQTARRVAGLVRPFRAKAALVLALSLVAVAIELAPPLLQKTLVDRVLDVENAAGRMQELLSLLLAIVVGLLLIRLTSTGVALWKGYVGSVIGTSLTAELRSRLVKKLHSLPLAFHDRHQVGALMSRVAYDTETMHTLVHHITSGFLLQVLQLVGIGAMLFYLNWKLAAITMLPMPVVLLGSWYFTRYLYPRHHRYWEAVGRQAAALTGMLAGIRVVKAFAQEEREWQRFCRSSLRLRDSRQTVDVTTAGFTAWMGFVFGLGGLAVWYVGGGDILAGRMTLGSLMAFLAYLAMFYAPLTSLAEAVTWFSSFLAASHRIFGLLESTEEERQPAHPKEIRSIRGAIEFSNVTFGYHPDQTVLDQVSFRIRPGETVGIVGRSGSGKSTLVSLIGRLYEIRGGRLTIDGVDVRELNSRALRRNIGMVLQEPFLFPGSIAENIAYGHPDARPEEILAAARNADAHDFIMRMPYGYDTQIGEGGSGLSGGERQRISIARALMYDPPILIFDEATASVDALAEQTILRAIRRVARGRTTLVITHRLASVRDADRLLVFDQGRLLEEGSHATLVRAGGLYRSLVSIQDPGLATRSEEEAASDPIGLPDAPTDEEPPSAVESDEAAQITSPAGESQGGSGKCSVGPGELAWLDPASTRVRAHAAGRLHVTSADEEFHDVYALRAFPASCDGEFLSLRHHASSGHEMEIGMIRTLADWSDEGRKPLYESLARRYLLHRVLQVHKVSVRGDRLRMVVDTERGRAHTEVDKPAENIRLYGGRGILLTASDGSLYVIPDGERLAGRQKRLLAGFLEE